MQKPSFWVHYINATKIYYLINCPIIIIFFKKHPTKQTNMIWTSQFKF